MTRELYLLIKRIVVFVCGATIVLVGMVMLVTPGPAIVVIPAGLAVLATEFVWAKTLLKNLRSRIETIAKKTPPSEDPPKRG